MATIIQVEVNEEEFKELLEKELKDLPKEEIQKILLESIKSYFVHDDIQEVEETKDRYSGEINPAKIIRKPNYEKLNALLIRRKSGYGCNQEWTEPTDLFNNMLKQCDFSGLQDIVDEMIKDLKENYHDILVEVISKRIADSFIKDYGFQSEVANIVNVVLNQRNNNQ